MILLVLGGSGWLLLQTSRVQTWLVRTYVVKLEKQIGGSIQIGKIKAKLPRQIQIHDLVVWDQLGDTLLAVPETRVKIKNYNFKSNEFKLSSVRLVRPFVYLQEDPGGGLNLAFILSNLKGNGETQAPLDLSIEKLFMEGGHFKFHTFRAQPQPGRFNPNYMEVYNLDIELSELVLDEEALSGALSELRGNEISGLVVEQGKAEILFTNRELYLEDIDIKTAFSEFLLSDANLKMSLDSSDQGFNRLLINATWSPGSQVSEMDLNYFLPDLRGRRTIQFDGKMTMGHSTFHWDDAFVNYEGLLNYRGQVAVKGIPDWKNANYSLAIDTLWYVPSAHDATLPGLLVQLDTLTLPVVLDSLGVLSFKGIFDGGFAAFSTAGSFRSKAGRLSGEIAVKRGKKIKTHEINGQIRGRVRNLDGLLASQFGISTVQFTGSFNGLIANAEEYDLNLDFAFPNFNFLKYGYKDLELKGKALNKTFDGVVLVKDQNLDLYLEALVDFQKEIPSFEVEMSVGNAQLNALNISSLDSLEVLSLNLHGAFQGTSMDNLDGQLWITDSYYENTRGKLPINEINLTIVPELGKKKVNLVSDYVDARLFGDIHLEVIVPQLEWMVRRFLPMNNDTHSPDRSLLNDFSFNVQLKNPRPLTEILTPAIIFKENTQINGFIEKGGLEWELEGFSPQYVIADNQFTDLAFRIVASNDSIRLNSSLQKLQVNKYTEFDQIQFDFVLTPDLLTSQINWNNRDSLETKGILRPQLRFEPGLGKWPRTILSLPETEIVFKDTVWQIHPFQLVMDQSLFRFDSLRIQHNQESLLVHGSISDLPLDTLQFRFNQLNLSHLNTFKGEKASFELTGLMNGEARVFDLHEKGLFLADISIADFTVNGEVLGTTNIKSNRKAGEDNIFMKVLTSRGDISTLSLSGYFNPLTDGIDFDLNLEKLRMNIFNGVLDPVLKDIRGIASGKIKVSGTRSEPLFNGEINLQKAAFYVGYLNTRYTFTHPVLVSPEGFFVKDLIARDKDGNEALVNGGVLHNKFKDIRLDFGLDVTRFLALNCTEEQDHGFWGTAYATGLASIRGPLRNIKIDVTATTEQGTDFALPVNQQREAREIDFITFVQKDTLFIEPDLLTFDRSPTRSGYDVDLSGIEISLDIEVNPQARVQIIIDEKTGNILRARGSGNLNMAINTRGLFDISGEYLINQGDYQFTLQNMPLKRFEIEPGGRVMLNGPLSQASINVDAIYSTKAALYDLILDETNTDLRQRIPVECHLLMNGFLENPELEFKIVLPPNSDDIARSQLSNLSQEEMNKQILTLLILSRFSPLPGLSSSNPRSYENAGITTTTEVLSNQLNYLLSQISNDFDIGFNYRPGDELTSDEVAVALKAQLLGDRMTINVNGNVDVRSVETDANQLVGDVEVDYKITPSGKLRVKAFTRANDRLLYEYSQYTQGFGVFFREEFDTFGTLMKKYWDGVFKKSP